jgi:hypothetical protein
MLLFDPNILISYPETGYFYNCMNNVTDSLNKWFKSYKLSLTKQTSRNLLTTKKLRITLNVDYDIKITEVGITKFTGLQTDNSLNCKINVSSA